MSKSKIDISNINTTLLKALSNKQNQELLKNKK